MRLFIIHTVSRALVVFNTNSSILYGSVSTTPSSAELKHGRVAQLAVLGYIVPEIYKFPGDIAPGISFASIPNGIAAILCISLRSLNMIV